VIFQRSRGESTRERGLRDSRRREDPLPSSFLLVLLSLALAYPNLAPQVGHYRGHSIQHSSHGLWPSRIVARVSTRNALCYPRIIAHHRGKSDAGSGAVQKHVKSNLRSRCRTIATAADRNSRSTARSPLIYEEQEVTRASARERALSHLGGFLLIPLADRLKRKSET